MPLTSQVTPLMEALNCWLPKFATVTALGDTVIEPDEPLVTVTVADANFEVSAMEVAVTVT
jgi:hypothetical protein